MRIDVILTVDMISQDKIKDKTVVVIDTLRATSSIVTALANGCKKIIPVIDIKEAREIANKLTADCLLAGERKGVQLKGFDLGNSPQGYSVEEVKDKIVVLTTTNGTKCFTQLDQAKEVLVASLLNLEMLIEHLVAKEEIVFCCAGFRGEFALDDFITAGKAINLLSYKYQLELGDEALVACQTYLANRHNLLSVIKRSNAGRNLISLGKEDDIEYIVSNPQFTVVPIYKNGEIVK